MVKKSKSIRLQPHERERQIIDGAIEFFSEVGLSGQTRELAKRLGVTQGLIYRYFEDKEALIAKVYSTVFEGKWGPSWEQDLRDRSKSIRDRLVNFYTDYARIIHTREWVRIFLLAGLAQNDIPRRYLALLRKRLFPIVIEETLHAFGISDCGETAEQEELILMLHGMIFYVGIRKWVYRGPVPANARDKTSQYVDIFLFEMGKLHGIDDQPS